MNTELIPIYTLVDLRKVYILPDLQERVILDGITLAIPPGISAIRGPSGEGKTTLMNILATLDAPTGGEVYLGGERIQYDVPDALLYVRRKIGMVFQDHNLVSHLTAHENVALPLICCGVPRRQALAQAAQYLDALHMGDFLQHRPAQLSGGQKQRVGIARVLARRPSVVLADEPTGNLDRETGGDVMGQFHQLVVETATPVILVTHNAELANRYCDRQWELRGGRLQEIGFTPGASEFVSPRIAFQEELVPAGA